MTTDPGWDQSPLWTADGKAIAFTTRRTGNRDIALVPVDGGEVKNLTQSPLGEFDAAWLPDGTRLIYSAASRETVLVTVGVEELLKRH